MTDHQKEQLQHKVDVYNVCLWLRDAKYKGYSFGDSTVISRLEQWVIDDDPEDLSKQLEICTATKDAFRALKNEYREQNSALRKDNDGIMQRNKSLRQENKKLKEENEKLRTLIPTNDERLSIWMLLYSHDGMDKLETHYETIANWLKETNGSRYYA